jgi:hypothetical protein
VGIKVTTGVLVNSYILIDPFMAETDKSVHFKPATDLFMTPIFFDEFPYKKPLTMSNTLLNTISFTASSKTMSLFGPIASSTSVAFYLTANC